MGNTSFIFYSQFIFVVSCVSPYNMSSDSDSEFSDAADTDPTEKNEDIVRAAKTNKDGLKVRGKDLEWVETHKFANSTEYKDSDIAKQLEKEFTVRKNREFAYADVLIYHCRFSRKVGYLACPWQIKVSFLTHSSEVIVESLDGLVGHKHDEDPESVNKTGAVFKWTEDQNSIIEGCLKIQKNTKPNYIKRKPSQVQLYNKIAATKKKLFPSDNILNTYQFRQRIADELAVPESEVKGFVPYWDIIDETDDEDPRFCVVFSTVKNQGKLACRGLLQTDATYRLNWMGFPVFVLGKHIIYSHFSHLKCNCCVWMFCVSLDSPGLMPFTHTGHTMFIDCL